MTRQDRPTPLRRRSSSTPRIPAFLLPQSITQQILSFPSQLFFAFMGMLGLAHYARQVVRVRPSHAGLIALKRKGDKIETEGGKVSVDEWITKNTPSLSGDFTPSWWLPNGHLQTFFIVAGNFTKVDKVDYVRTLIRVPDGGTLALDMTPPNHESLPADAPTVMVSHGLTGNANESYVRNILSWVAKPKSEGGLGGRGVVVNFRGCGGSPITSTQMYSAAASGDVNNAAHFLRATFPDSSLHGIGFSLGASVTARYLGEQGDKSLMSSGCVLGCPWNVVDMSHALEDGFFKSRIYSAALGQNLIRMFFRNYDANPDIYEAPESRVKDAIPELKELRKLGSKVRLKQVDNVLTTKCGGPLGAFPFPDADAYYRYAGTDQHIHNVKVPLLAINAFDDPVIHGEALPVTEVHASSHVHLAVTGGGGHLGWFDGPMFGERDGKTRTSRWIKRPITEFLTAAARDLPPRARITTTRDSDGWDWVDAPPMSPQIGAPAVKIGWKVLQAGVPLEKWGVDAEAGKTVIQGL